MRLRLAQFLLVATLLAALPAENVCAAAGSAEPPFRFYSAVDGLTQSDVSDIEQDRAGYLWFTTMRGLNRYDGREFTHYTIADGLRANNLTALHIDADNTVRVGDYKGGMSIISGIRVVQTIEPPDNDSAAITDIEIVGERVIVLAEGSVFMEVIGDGLDARLVPLGGPDIGATSIVVDGDEVWVAASSGLYRLMLEPMFRLKQVSTDIRHIHIADDGGIWVADLNNRIGLWQDGRLDVRAIIDTENDLICVMPVANGAVWVATENGLFGFDDTGTGMVQSGELIRRYDDVTQLSSLFVDRENTLWLASDSRLIRFLGDRFRHYRLKTESDAETVWAISEDSLGRLWFGTQDKLLVREEDETLTVIGPDHGIPRGAVRDIVHGADENLWVGVRGKGLYQLPASTMQAELVDGTSGLEILDIALVDDAAIWFSTLRSGVFRYAPQSRKLKQFGTPENTSVYSLDAWEDGSIWYGADEVGLVHLVPQGNDLYSQQIIQSPQEMEDAAFDHVRVTGENKLWIATEEGGLYFFDNGSFESQSSDAPWADQTVYLVDVLQNGTVVVGGEQGLYQFQPGSEQIAHYDQLSGFAGVETNVHATFIDSTNRLWIGTVEGATSMNTALPMPGLVEIMPEIVSMETDLDHLPVIEDMDIDPGQRGIHVDFAAVSLLSPKGAEYSYKLIGAEDTWLAPTSNKSVNYSGMKPGSYEFTVRARLPGGKWSPQSSTRRFSIMPFFWQRQWFALAIILLAFLLFRAAMNYRTRSIEQMNENLRAQVAERTKSIEQAKQNLQVSNEKLSREIRERKKSDKARFEVEKRFRLAFENTPIGVGLLDQDGRLFDANRALRQMFWPQSSSVPKIKFAKMFDEDDKARFTTLHDQLTRSETDNIEESFCCHDSEGGILQTVVSLSAVHSDEHNFLYSVLQVQDVTEAKRLTDQLEYQASYDDLTGLLNRRSFETELDSAWKSASNGSPLSYLMYMDLDQFKVVNDTSGHAAGDQLLRMVSDIIIENVRANDTVCRLGGDEFGIILWKCPTQVARKQAEAIRAAVDNLRFQWEKEIYRVGVSIGGLPIDPKIGDARELQQLADAACYAAKEEGRNRVHMVHGEKDTARAHRGQLRWVQRLREAMDNNRFTLYGQVIMAISGQSDEPDSLEILLRLREPNTRKLIPPSAFLPAAERYGMSTELDEWVVRNLLDTLYIHQTMETEYRKYWVNLSGTSVGDKRFAKFLVNAIKESPLPRGTINFEITETAVIRSIAEAGKLMAELSEMGCQFALDDFGSGLSSFGYLKKLPVDILKIDGMFIRDILRDQTDRIFVKSIIDIAHTLNIKTVAEFVENDAMLDVMRELGADYVQGFGIGRPFPISPTFPDSVNPDITYVDLQAKVS